MALPPSESKVRVYWLIVHCAVIVLSSGGMVAGISCLEITLGQASGLELCRELLSIEPRTNVVFLTDTQDHAFLAWDTGACGYLLKPLTAQAVHRQLSLLRHPLKGI